MAEAESARWSVGLVKGTPPQTDIHRLNKDRMMATLPRSTTYSTSSAPQSPLLSCLHAFSSGSRRFDDRYQSAAAALPTEGSTLHAASAGAACASLAATSSAPNNQSPSTVTGLAGTRQPFIICSTRACISSLAGLEQEDEAHCLVCLDGIHTGYQLHANIADSIRITFNKILIRLEQLVVRRPSESHPY